MENTHAYITFGYSHLGFSTPHISFRSFDATLGLDPQDIGQSSFSLSIDVDSIDSKVEKFDGHLKSADMFEVEKFPEAKFVATQLNVVDGKIAVTGDLTMRDVTKSVEAIVTINKAAMNPRNNVPTIGLSAQAKLNRSDWNLGYASPMVGEEVSIYFDAEFIQGE
ncbi:MAG: YceI family protein [Pseudomonadota bacterium]